jgi:hypothetical protein
VDPRHLAGSPCVRRAGRYLVGVSGCAGVFNSSELELQSCCPKGCLLCLFLLVCDFICSRCSDAHQPSLCVGRLSPQHPPVLVEGSRFCFTPTCGNCGCQGVTTVSHFRYRAGFDTRPHNSDDSLRLLRPCPGTLTSTTPDPPESDDSSTCSRPCLCERYDNKTVLGLLESPQSPGVVFSDSWGPGGHTSAIFPAPSRRGTGPSEDFGRPPLDKIALHAKIRPPPWRRPHVGLAKLFSPGGPPEFSTGVGSLPRKCLGNFRRVFPHTPGIRE